MEVLLLTMKEISNLAVIHPFFEGIYGWRKVTIELFRRMDWTYALLVLRRQRGEYGIYYTKARGRNDEGDLTDFSIDVQPSRPSQ